MGDHAVITPPGSNLTGVVDDCLADLARVAENIRWAHAVGYGKASVDRDAPRGTGSTPVFTLEDVDGRPADDDQVPGPTFDIGVGDYTCRLAYQNVAERLAVVELKATLAALTAGAHRRQKPRIRPTSHSTLHDVLACVEGIEWRLRLVRLDLDDVDRPTRRATRPHLNAARRLLDRSVAELLTPLTRARRDPIPLTPNCVRCGIRPQAERTRRRKGRVWVEPSEGGRCDTCARWKRRHNGEERPTYLDEKPVAEAQAARARRMARGEGWGDA